MPRQERTYLVYEVFEETVEYTIQATSMKDAIAKVRDPEYDKTFEWAGTSDPKRTWARRATAPEL